MEDGRIHSEPAVDIYSGEMSADGVKQVGPDDDMTSVVMHLGAKRMEPEPSAVLVTTGAKAWRFKLRGRSFKLAPWSEYLFLADTAPTQLGVAADMTMRVLPSSMVLADEDDDVTHLLVNAQRVLRGEQRMPWSKVKAPALAGTTGDANRRVKFRFSDADAKSPVEIHWFHTQTSRVFSDGRHINRLECRTTGAAQGANWYRAGGVFNPISRASIS